MVARELAGNALWSLASHALHRGSLMIAAIILARTLPPDDFAAYGYFQITVAMLATYAALGLGVTASRYFSEIGTGLVDEIPPVGALLALSLLLSGVAFLVILSLPSGILEAGAEVNKWMVALGVAVTVAGIVPGGGIVGLEKYRHACIVSCCSALVTLLLAVVAARSRSPELAMWGLVLGLSVQAIGQMVVIASSLGLPTIARSFRWSGDVVKKIAGFAGPMFLVSVLAGSGTWVVGRLILAGGGAREFAAYSIGLQWLALGLLLPGMVSRVLMPRVVRSEKSELSQVVRTGLVMALASAMLIAVTGLVFSRHIARLYGPEYFDYWFVVPAFLFVAVLSSPVNTLGNAIVAKDGQGYWLLTTVIATAVLIAVLVLAPTSSSAWACCAHGASAATMLLMGALRARRDGLV